MSTFRACFWFHLALRVFYFLPSVAAAAAEYDFIVIGGGTAGLAVANRLTEISSITVAVIEAGDQVFTNPNVTDVDKFTVTLGSAIDWQYESTNQTYSGGQKIGYHGGKALGGTSTINGMTYVRAQKSQIDSWKAIGNDGWTWDELLPYYKKSEGFAIPTSAQLDAGASYDPQDHGTSGPLKTGYLYGLLNGSFHSTIQDSWKALGLPLNNDLNGGDVRGFGIWPNTADRDANVREDAARAYYYPFQTRENLHLLLNTTANRITWQNLTTADVVAAGVEVTHQNGSVEILNARKEVIVSAGSLRSPAILEHSGIGNPSILSKLNIPCKVNLPGVGENLQDQPNNGIIFNSNLTIDGAMPYVAFGTVADFNVALPDDSVLQSWAGKVAADNGNGVNASALEYLFKIQYDLLNQGVPQAEVSVFSTISYGVGPSGVLASPFWLLMPWSRGNVHVTSSNPLIQPAINPNFFQVDFDLDVQVAIGKWTRKFWSTAPISNLGATETTPGLSVLPENATDSQWGDWVKSSFGSNSHPLGTVAMMPQDLGGVVDSRLKVYGTSNVRVVDASIFPFQVSGHLTSTIYAISEKAGDMIKQDVLGM